MKKVLILISKGFEEIEAVSAIDVMRRGGLDVTIAAVGGNDLVVAGANGIKILADYFLRELDLSSFIAIVLPGGYANAMTLAKDELAQMVIKKFHSDGLLVAAICAAPLALDAAGIIKDNYTCYPGCEAGIQNGVYTENTVELASNVLTSRGPGTAICFGLAIVENLLGEEVMNNVKKGLLASYC